MQGRPGKITALILFMMVASGAWAQEIEVKGGFIEDEMLLGENINFWMTAAYPPHFEMVLPDSNYNFNPFEFSDRTYFETRLIEGKAFDSVVYLLQSYEIDQVQYLSLPGVILNQQDSMVIKTGTDSIRFVELAPVVSDTTRLQTNVNYQPVRRQFNFPLMYYILAGLLVIILIVLLVFGKRIVRYVQLRRLRKEYEKFSEQLTGYIHQLKKEPSPEVAEEALVLWKNYQQKLDEKPFGSYTTKEILSLQFTSELEKPLQSIDRLIYGRRPQASVYQDFQQIEDFTQHRYTKKIAEIQDGK